MGDWNSEALEVNIWMETQGITNTIYDLHGYSYALITYKQPKDCPIDNIYCSAHLAANWGGFLSFVRLVGYHRSLWIYINESILIGFRKHEIIPTMERNLRLEYTRTIKKFNDTLHTIFFKHDIYLKIYYIHNRAIYPVPIHPASDFEILDELITHLMYALDKKCRSKITDHVKW